MNGHRLNKTNMFHLRSKEKAKGRSPSQAVINFSLLCLHTDGKGGGGHVPKVMNTTHQNTREPEYPGAAVAAEA